MLAASQVGCELASELKVGCGQQQLTADSVGGRQRRSRVNFNTCMTDRKKRTINISVKNRQEEE
jgi:hypothetical protein